MASNQPLQTNPAEAANSRQPLDGLLGGMAGCIVKERNMGPMLLRLLSGSGLNVNAMDKQYIMVFLLIFLTTKFIMFYNFIFQYVFRLVLLFVKHYNIF